MHESKLIKTNTKYVGYVEVNDNLRLVSPNRKVLELKEKHSLVDNADDGDDHEATNRFIWHRHCCWVIIVLIVNLIYMFGYTLTVFGSIYRRLTDDSLKY